MIDRHKTPDREAEERLQLLLRWSRVIRHDLGNVIFPSRSLMESAAAEGESGKKLRNRVNDLCDMMTAGRQVLSYLRPVGEPDAHGATILSEWWSDTKHILRAVPQTEWKFSGPQRSDLAVPVSECGLTNLVLAVLIAADLQVEPETPAKVSIDLQLAEQPTLHIATAGQFPIPPRVLDPIHRIAKVLGGTLSDRFVRGVWTLSYQ